MTFQGSYDLCVIGAGTAGYAAARAAISNGRNVLVINKPGDLGGACIRRGCMPAKTLLTATERLRILENAENVGISTGNSRVDLRALVERKDDLVRYFVESRLDDFKDIPTQTGIATFTSPASVRVDGQEIEATRFLIATGSRVAPPAIPGLVTGGYFTSDDAMNMTEVPGSLLVIGAGPVGCEFAQYFARLGSRVILSQEEAEILRNEDDVASVVRTSLERDGIRVMLRTRVERLERSPRGFVATCRDGPRLYTHEVDRVMLATGRVPDVSSLDLPTAGVALVDGKPVVDRFLCTGNPRIYAAGDVLGRRCLVHAAEFAAVLAERNAFSETPVAVDFSRLETHAIYTQPQVAVADSLKTTHARPGYRCASLGTPSAILERLRSPTSRSASSRCLRMPKGTSWVWESLVPTHST